MRLFLLVLLVVHGLIHLMGFAKAFGLGDKLPLTQPIARPLGLAWLLASLGFVAAALLFGLHVESWWWVGAPALVLSQALIMTSWRDARAGTLVNLILLLPLVAAALEARPTSYRNQYRAAVREGLSRSAPAELVTDADLAHLPPPVQEYLRYTGAVGRPRVRNFRAVFSGRFRNGLEGRWMPFRSEQYDFLDQPTRVFLMRASAYGLPMEGLHLFRGPTATMRIKAASFVEVVNAKGREMNQGETVTFFNDLCLMAPSSLIDKERIEWESAGPLTARARFTNQGVTIGALLSFDRDGRLTDFLSNDRFLSADGKSYTSYPWSTPVRDYRRVGGRVLPSSADLVWLTPEGEFNYARFNLVEIEYNLREPL